MLKNLLKYEFRATGRTYGGLYLVWLLVALAMGISMRDEVWDNGSSQIWAYLMFAYFAIGVAIGVVCIVTIIQRFTKNLLGREGYLMHTLPVHPEQLVASKLISSMVWVICSGVVGILSVLLMLVGLGAFEDPKTVINGETITTGWGDVLKFSWKAIQSIGGEFWSELAWIIVLGLAGVAVLILCIYAASVQEPFHDCQHSGLLPVAADSGQTGCRRRDPGNRWLCGSDADGLFRQRQSLARPSCNDSDRRSLFCPYQLADEK